MARRTAEQTDVAIVGSGPYGLSVAAHLAHRGRATFRIFGPPMSFWRAMPKTLNLKSFAFATSLSVPRPHFTFPEYCRSHGLPDLEPCTMESFAAYGVWVQESLLPDAEDTQVTRVEQSGDAFEIRLADERTLRAGSVVVATGLSGLEYLPPALRRLPPDRVSHSSTHHDYGAFRGQRVAVFGAGASAIEAATLLHESGASPLLVVRGDEVVFHDRYNPERSLRERLRAPNSVLGPGRKSWVLEHFPRVLHFVPDARRVPFTRRYLGPAGPWWIKGRFDGNVPTVLGSEVESAEVHGGKVRLVLRVRGHEQVEEVDRVVAGTGFEVDVDRYTFLDAGLRGRIRRVERAPALSRHFETSVRGLYFVGPSAALSFGPLFRFVAGARVAAPVVAHHVTSRARRSKAA
jgi:FAD-dependent urate hydroxylase